MAVDPDSTRALVETRLHPWGNSQQLPRPLLAMGGALVDPDSARRCCLWVDSGPSCCQCVRPGDDDRAHSKKIWRERIQEIFGPGPGGAP